MTNHNKNLNLVYAVSFVDLFAVGLTFPLMANHLRSLGASHFAVGAISSLYSGLQVISGPIVGSWSDVRDRKSVLTITLLVSGASYIVLGLTSSIFVITITRVVLGIAKHTQSLCKAIITDLLPVSERAGAFGQAAAFSSLGFIVGPVIGGHLSEVSNGFSYVCGLTGLLFVINIGLISIITETRKQEDSAGNNSTMWPNFRKELYKSVTDLTDIDWKALWDTFLLRFIFGFSITMYFSQQSVYLREQFDLSQKHVGYIISLFSVTSAVSAFSMRTISDLFYKNDKDCFARLAHFFALMAISSVCLYLAPNLQTFLLFLVPFSISSTVLRVASMELMLKEDAKRHMGSLSGASNSIMSVARFVTPATAGLITDWFGGHSAMLFSAFPPLIGTAVVAAMTTKHNTKVKHS